MAIVLLKVSQRVRRNLTTVEWQEMRGFVRSGLTGKSKSRPWTNLSGKERKRLRTLVGKAITGRSSAR
jgi:hypothetical protein